MENHVLQRVRPFHFTELKRITNDFSEERVIGRGGSGVVYKGVLDNGEVIAVKKLHNRYDSSGKKLGHSETQFLNELLNLFGLQHPNIIRLVGYCHETHSIVIKFDGKHVLASEDERILCLEYMHGGSLQDHLSDESCGLEWHARFNIIKGVCEGLKYLHTGCENPIYHLDLKPENIWLDRNMIPKIGDFGISRLPADLMQTYDTKRAVSGTIGYMAPEYIAWNQISQKCDVYSLGFIMMRVIAGEKFHQYHDPDSSSMEFIERVHKNWFKRHKATMSSHSLEQVKICAELALRCVEFDRKKRPTITDIVDELNRRDAAGCSPCLHGCQENITSLVAPKISGCQNMTSIPGTNRRKKVPLLEVVVIEECHIVSTGGAEAVAEVKRVVIIRSVPTGMFGDFSFLAKLIVDGCPNICSQSLVSPSLKQLNLGECGSLLHNIDCCSLTKFIISSYSVTSIQPQMWSLPALRELLFIGCRSLTHIEVSTIPPLGAGTHNIRAFSKLNFRAIFNSNKLSIVDGLLTKEFLPAIETIFVDCCKELKSLPPGERFGSFRSLKDLYLCRFPCLNLQS